MNSASDKPLKVDKGIPIPERKPRGGDVAALMRAMEIGDSILLPNSRNAASQYALRYLGKGNYATRKEEGGVRVWRIKNEEA